MEILSLGKKIKLHRKKLNMTLKDLAGDRITAAQISHIERDKSYPSQDLLAYFAKKLGVTVDYLLETKEAQAKHICDMMLLEAENYLCREKYDKAIEKILGIVKVTEEYEVVEEEAKAKYLIGTIYEKMGENTRAARYLEESIRLYAGIGDDEGVVKAYLQLGLNYYHRKYYRSALDKFQQAEIVISKKKLMDLGLELKTYHYSSLCAIRIGQDDLAIEYAQKATKIQERIDNPQDYGETLSKYACSYLEKGDMELAQRCLHKALEMYKKAEEKKELAMIEDSLAYIYLRTNQYEKALRHLNSAYAIKKEIKDITIIDTLLEQVNYFTRIGSYDQALEKAQEALQLCSHMDLQDQKIKALRGLAQIHKARGDYPQAREIVLEIIRNWKPVEMSRELANIYIDLAEIYDLTEEKSISIDCYRKGVDMLKDLGIIAG